MCIPTSCKCGWDCDINECDVGGACDGCVFCPECGVEFEAETGKPHALGACCLDATQDGNSPTASGVSDSVSDEQLLSEWRGENGDKQQNLF